MEEHSQNKFLNQFIEMIRKDVKQIGIITDKDGTILLDDNLKDTLKEFKKKKIGTKIYLIANSGRTIQDMINCLKEQKIPLTYFDYIIGDNGGMCLDIRTKKLLYKHVMEPNVVSKVIQEFLMEGGTLEDIRLADGKNIYAYPSTEVEEYYKFSKDIVFKKDIIDLDNIDITKLTLTGSHDLINKLNSYIRENIKGFKTHIGKTSFPSKDRNNYRMDFTGMHTKGEAAKILKKKLRLDTCIYLGNDFNDISMFSNALDDNDFIVIANHEQNDITEALVTYLKEECKIKGIDWKNVKLLVLDEQNANKFLYSINRILGRINSEKSLDIRKKYRIEKSKEPRPRQDKTRRRRDDNYR